jgi:predicted metal-dependent HD superfamily phosphohydrolase
VGEVLLAGWAADIAVLAPHTDLARRRAEGELLVRGWTEPQRAYHTLQHLAEVLTALEELAGAGEVDACGLRVARVAAWYHDLSYDPRAAPGSNEHRSATLARDHLHRLGVAADVVDLVEDLILMTADHQQGSAEPAPRHTDVRAAFHDADLWILTAPVERFDDYCRQVRREYAHVPQERYAAARAEILRGLVGRGPIYRTAHATTHWQRRALGNVARELARLAAQS